MANLDETTRQVYKENMSLAEQLSERIKEEELLKKLNHRLTSEHSLLSAEEENSKAVIKEKKSTAKRNHKNLKSSTITWIHWNQY
ncbi:hypothetical protein EB796_011786 [Bugula neritina]|uniref:Uncharacterized protein n=1 Tax=Bugula neritina TaxID=10212 RepID=A0A7J7JVM2_BUGNE|nr:hypothetical protein EB796_011786 [Bugula neritina]